MVKQIAVLTSGGDAPGMNAAIRAVTRTAIGKGWSVLGVRNGFAGLITGNFVPLRVRDVGGIMQIGGTVLGSARCPEFKTEDGRMAALRMLSQRDVDALVVIGGNGSQTGAYELSRMGYPVVGVASTIDNDLAGSEITIGVDTALNIALEAIDRLKVTASSHQRAFLVEVMGRECGYLALMAGIAGGAELSVIPEVETDPEEVASIRPRRRTSAARRTRWSSWRRARSTTRPRWRRTSRYIASASASSCGSRRWATCSAAGPRGRPTGCWPRGWAPPRPSRSRAAGTACCAGPLKGEIVATPLAEIVGRPKPLDTSLIELANVLAQ